jgi:tetratricopeptide (TPR) repeat protein
VGHDDDALVACSEAVAIYRRLSSSRPEAFLPDLATGLNNLGEVLRREGDAEEALVAAEEAVRIRRGLASSRPDAFLANLATSLNNLGINLAELGRLEESLAAVEEALELHTNLALTLRNRFLGDVAMSFLNLGWILSKLERWEEGLRASEQAIEHYRLSLACSVGDAPDLAASLHLRGSILIRFNRFEEASAVAEDGLRILLPFLLRYPSALAKRATEIRDVYTTACEEAGSPRDTDLVHQVDAAVARARRRSRWRARAS